MRGQPSGPGRSRIRVTDVLFYVGLGFYALGGVGVLLLGLGAIVTYNSPSLHSALHVWASPFPEGVLARTALRMADGSHFLESPIQIILDYAFSLLNITLAAFLLWLRPRDRTARFMAVGMIGTAGMFNLEAQSIFQAVPLNTPEAVLQGAAHVIAGLSYAYALLLFPDGRPVPRWRGWAQALLFAPVATVAAFYLLRAEGTARPASLIVLFGIVIPAAGVVAQGYRFRRSAGAQEHQQARLLFWALLPALVIGILFVVKQGQLPTTTEAMAGRGLSELPVLTFRIFQPVFAIIPVALFAGLVRYRLWDVDRVINRTLVYTLLTATLGGAYVATIVLLQRVLSPLTQGQDVAIAASTLAAAAAFGPVRGRIQSFVDRRFNRRRYDAAQTIEAFTSRLRDEIDLDSLTVELGAIVIEAMEPEHTSIWLRGADGSMTWMWTRRPDDGDGSGAPLPVTIPERPQRTTVPR